MTDRGCRKHPQGSLRIRRGLIDCSYFSFYADILLTSEANDVWRIPEPADVFSTDDLQRIFSEANQILSSAIDCS